MIFWIIGNCCCCSCYSHCHNESCCFCCYWCTKVVGIFPVIVIFVDVLAVDFVAVTLTDVVAVAAVDVILAAAVKMVYFWMFSYVSEKNICRCVEKGFCWSFAEPQHQHSANFFERWVVKNIFSGLNWLQSDKYLLTSKILLLLKKMKVVCSGMWLGLEFYFCNFKPKSGYTLG